MPEILEYVRPDERSAFGERFAGLKDPVAKARVDTAVRKLGRGLKPDVKSVGDGVHEARIDYGPGYRIYFANDGPQVIILLLCGDKRTQDEDISMAKADWAEYGTRKNAMPYGARVSRPRQQTGDA